MVDKKRFAKFMTLTHPLYLRYPEWCLCWVMCMNFETYKQAVSRLSPIVRPMVTSLSIQLFMGQKGRLSSKIRPRKCTKWLSIVAAHWAYKKGIKGRSIKGICYWMNWSRRWWIPRPGWWCQGILTLLKKTILAEEIYVFYPDGAVRSLPKRSDRLTLAHEIHTKVGESDWCRQWSYGSADKSSSRQVKRHETNYTAA